MNDSTPHKIQFGRDLFNLLLRMQPWNHASKANSTAAAFCVYQLQSRPHQLQQLCLSYCRRNAWCVCSTKMLYKKHRQSHFHGDFKLFIFYGKKYLSILLKFQHWFDPQVNQKLQHPLNLRMPWTSWGWKTWLFFGGPESNVILLQKKPSKFRIRMRPGRPEQRMSKCPRKEKLLRKSFKF